MGKRLWPWILVVFALSIALLIRVPSQSVTERVTNREFTLAINQNPNTLDPALADNLAASAITQNIFQTLLQESRGGELIPDLARTVTVQGRVIHVTLSRAETTSGHRVSASMVAESLARPLWSQVGSAAARRLLSPIVGSGQVIAGSSRFLSGVVVTGSESFNIDLSPGANISQFLHGLASPSLAIVPITDQSQGQASWQFTNLIGTTPWILKDWSLDSSLLFQRNRPGPGPSQIEAVVYQNQRQSVLSVVNGVLDAAPVNPGEVPTLKKRWRSYLRLFPTSGTLSLYYRGGRGSGYSAWSISQWIRRALGPDVTSLSSRWPSALLRNRPMTIWVNASDTLAVDLAQTLAAMEPLVSVHETSGARLTALAAQGTITAYIGLRNRFSHSLTVPLAHAGYLWAVSPSVARLSLFSDGVLNWSSIQWKR